MSEQMGGPEGRWPEEDESTRRLEEVVPDHEIDPQSSIGGGVVAAGGTAENRSAGAPPQHSGANEGDPSGPPAHLDEDDQPVMDRPDGWVFGGRSG
jgi:hypothetical protein